MSRVDQIKPGRPLRTVGAPARQDSAIHHVSGSALYVDDIRAPEGMLHVAVGGASVARGRLDSLDLAAVREAPGVVAVLTAKDVPGENDVGCAGRGEPIFADGNVSFHGQALFAVVAATREAARRAVKLAKIAIAAEPPLVSVDQALAANSYVLPDHALVHGNYTAAFAASPRQLADTLRIGGQAHFYLEGQVALAIPDEDGVLFHASSQNPGALQHMVARVLKLPATAVTVQARHVGGSFGGKETQAAQWAAIAALAARVTKHPCKLRLDRAEDMIMTGKGHDFRADYHVGFDAEGRITAYDVTLASRCGHSPDMSSAVNDNAMLHADNGYFLPAAHIASKRMQTNTVSNSAFRGLGAPQGMMAIERAVDAIAWTLGLDPLDVRKRNLYGPGRDTTPYGMPVTDNILPELIEGLEQLSNYRERRNEIAAFNAGSAILRRGLALTPVKFGISPGAVIDQAGALVQVYQDGSVHLSLGVTEVGQGLFTKMAQVVAEEFGIDVDYVQVARATTVTVSSASPMAVDADFVGIAAHAAAAIIKERLRTFAQESHGVATDQIAFTDNTVVIGNRTVAFSEFIKQAYLGRVALSAAGHYRAPKSNWDREKAKGRPFQYFCFGAACSEVMIDTFTGEMKVTRIDILQDVGRSLNPAIDLGQIEGGFVQGMGWLTSEELIYGRDGQLLTQAPSTYKIPTVSDVPADFRVALFPSDNREDTIFGSKAVGEPPLALAISVFAAIADAIHSLAPRKLVPLDAPATSEAILRAVNAVREN